MSDGGIIAVELLGGRGGYVVEGEGPTVVLLVTPFVTAAIYEPTRRALRRRFRVVTVELPGTANHPPVERPWTLDEYARWVAALLEALRLDDVTLIGHSNSAGTALLTGLRCPARLRGIVLADAIGADGSFSFADVLAGALVSAPLEARYVLRLLPVFVTSLWRHTRNFVKQFVVSVRRDLRPEARRLRVPTLVAWGALDFVMPLSCARALMRRLPDAELYVSGRGSHDWLIEWPDEFATAVGGFVAKARLRRTRGARVAEVEVAAPTAGVAKAG